MCVTPRSPRTFVLLLPTHLGPIKISADWKATRSQEYLRMKEFLFWFLLCSFVSALLSLSLGQTKLIGQSRWLIEVKDIGNVSAVSQIADLIHGSGSVLIL